MLAGCTGSNLDNLFKPQEQFQVNGSFFLIRMTRTNDGINLTNIQPPQVAGLMKIADSTYIRDVQLSGDSTITRDQGTVSVSGNQIALIPADTSQVVDLGVLDTKFDQIRVNYTSGDYLFTETWQRVTETGPLGL